MASYTENLNLKMPEQDEFYNIDDFNDNMRKLDEKTTALEEVQKPATKDTLGLVKIGDNLTVDEEGKVNGPTEYTHPVTKQCNYVAPTYTHPTTKQCNYVAPTYTHPQTKQCNYSAPVSSVAGKTGAVTLAKGDVGLGSVLNYGIATTAEAQSGVSNTKYMTPALVKAAIEYLVTSGGISMIKSRQSGFINASTSSPDIHVGTGEDAVYIDIPISAVNPNKCILQFDGLARQSSSHWRGNSLRLTSNNNLRISSTYAQFEGRWTIIEYV